MQKKTNSTYQKTLDNKTYKLCHYQQQGLCCMGCINRGRRGYYWLSGDDYKKREKHPSWKLVSKNRKQWMDKKLKYIPYVSRYHGELSKEISW